MGPDEQQNGFLGGTLEKFWNIQDSELSLTETCRFSWRQLLWSCCFVHLTERERESFHKAGWEDHWMVKMWDDARVLPKRTDSWIRRQIITFHLWTLKQPGYCSPDIFLSTRIVCRQLIVQSQIIVEKPKKKSSFLPSHKPVISTRMCVTLRTSVWSLGSSGGSGEGGRCQEVIPAT